MSIDAKMKPKLDPKSTEIDPKKLTGHSLDTHWTLTGSMELNIIVLVGKYRGT